MSLEVRRSEDFDGALNAAINERAEALIAVSSRLLFQQRQKILDFGSKTKIIMAGSWGDWDGMLLTYGPNQATEARRLAYFVDNFQARSWRAPTGLSISQSRLRIRHLQVD